MKYYSTVTKKLYNTEAELLKVEEAIKAEEAEKKAKEEALKTQRATRAKEVEEAFKAADAAKFKADDLLKKFVEDYGSFHMSYSTSTPVTKTNTTEDFVKQVFSFLGKEF